MDGPISRRARDIHAAVLPLEGAARAAALDAGVGDDAALRGEVEALLQAGGPPALAAGATIERYVVRGLLGTGGAADVYSVQHRTLGTRHALKLLHVGGAALQQRLLEEGRMQATLRHPNIVRVTDVLDLPQGLGLVMDEVEGPSLRARLTDGPMPLDEAVAVACGVLEGVAAAHARGLVHRDLKPANVLLERAQRGWVPRVADFGIARAVPAGGAPAAPRTRAGMAMGTPGYMAPEQYRDASSAGPAADVFSLGCILYELLAGRPAFRGTDFIALFHQADRSDRPRLADVAPAAPPALARVVDAALCADPALRPADAGALLALWLEAVDADEASERVDSAPWMGPGEASALDGLVDLADLADPTDPAEAPTQPVAAQPGLSAAVALATAPPLQARDLAVLLVDLADSTAMTAELGPARASAVWAAHDRVARDLLDFHGGREIDKTDGFLLVFDAVDQAADYALAYFAGLAALSAELDRTLASRAGLHLGPVVLRENTPEDIARGAKPIELDGIAKSLAARVMGLARPGQLLLTVHARQALQQPVGQVRSHGFWQLKGVPEPEELFEVGGDGATFAPPQGSAKSWRVARVEGGWVPVDDLPRKLPPRPSGSFGRSGELRALADALATGTSVVTLLGPGGIGKTHLAVRFAWQWMGAWPGGAWFVDLSDARTAAEVARAVAAALDLPLDDGDGIADLSRALAARESALLVLDNLEQIEAPHDATVGRLLAGAPGVQAVATSRHRLYLPGEHLVPVDPLPLPQPGDGAAGGESPSVQLFVARAQAASPRFTLEAAGVEAVVELVRLLDGLPLAIELAAARTRVMAPKVLLRRMGRRFDLLKRRGGTGRQGTLRDAIDWSWDLLDDIERAAFARLSVLEGSFDLEAVEALFDFDDWPDAPWPDELLEALVDKSLVRSVPVDDAVRFELLPHLREYAAEKLADPLSVRSPGPDPVTGPEVRAALRARHAAHYARWGEPTSLRLLQGPGAAAELARLALDLDNVVAAVRAGADAGDWVVASRAALGALALIQQQGPVDLAEEVAALPMPSAPPDLAPALGVALGRARGAAGRTAAAREALERALEQAQAVGAPLEARAAQEALAELGA